MERTPARDESASSHAPQTFQEQDERAAPAEDPTTLKFDGLMGVSNEDESGSDPYNRTGRFKRLVR